LLRIRQTIAAIEKPALGSGMKFLVDAHLPPGLCALLQAAGHDAVHTSQLPAQNRTTDQVINEVSAREERVVISKDTDFYYSHLLHQRPYKLVLVRTGNIRTLEVKELFQSQLPAIVRALAYNSLVELDRVAVNVVV
jgi:predicted nuclease of predicted toxin-antitoxin system